jgi:hypothetical protein
MMQMRVAAKHGDTRTLVRRVLLAALCAAATGLGACQSTASGDGRFAVADGAYEKTFDAARLVLREQRFTLDRVDAQAGVITTTSQPAAGLIAPWETVQSSASDEVEDLLHQQARRVRVEFVENEGGARVRGVVTVAVERQIVGLTTQTIDPQAEARGQAGVYTVVVRRDDALAARLAKMIEQRAAKAE